MVPEKNYLPKLFIKPAPGHRIFYLCEGDPVDVNPAIDSSIASLADRYDYMLVKEPIEISPSPVIAPETDLRGQLRIDEPGTEPVGGIGQAWADGSPYLAPSICWSHFSVNTLTLYKRVDII